MRVNQIVSVSTVNLKQHHCFTAGKWSHFLGKRLTIFVTNIPFVLTISTLFCFCLPQGLVVTTEFQINTFHLKRWRGLASHAKFGPNATSFLLHVPGNHWWGLHKVDFVCCSSETLFIFCSNKLMVWFPRIVLNPVVMFFYFFFD